MEAANMAGETQTQVSEKIQFLKGDILMQSTPFVYVLKSSMKGLCCEHCLRRKQGMQRCSGCATAYYCHRECQSASWRIHMKECKNLKRIKPKFPPDTARLLTRLIFRLQEEGYDYKENISLGWKRKFADLMDHCPEMKEDKRRTEHFMSLVQVLKDYIGEENLPTTEELLQYYGRVCVNSFSILDNDLNSVAMGVYLAASVIDHSCSPNAYASFHGTTLTLHSLIDWQEFDWSKVRISYIDMLNSRQQRIQELKEGYYFECDCPNCLDKDKENIESSVVCGNPTCSSPVPVAESHEGNNLQLGPCPGCGFSSFDDGLLDKYFEALKFTKEKLKEIKDVTCIDTCRKLIEAQGEMFHRLNLYRVKTLDAGFDSAIQATSWEEAVRYGEQNLDGLRYYYGKDHPVYGMTLLKMGKVELLLFKLKCALDHLEQAEPVLRNGLGMSHPIYLESLKPLLKQARQEISLVEVNGFFINPPQSSVASNPAQNGS